MGRRDTRLLASVEKLKRSAACTPFPWGAGTGDFPPPSGALSRRADGASPLQTLEVDALGEEAAVQADAVEEEQEFD
jgi:hypothetical protein